MYVFAPIRDEDIEEDLTGALSLQHSRETTNCLRLPLDLAAAIQMFSAQ